MAIRERLIYAIDVITDGARSGLNNFRGDINDTERTTGRFKSTATAAFATVKANVAEFALAAGAALVTFGAKSVMAFQNTAIEAGKFSDATKLSVEDASRWIEVAGDMGISASTIQTSFTKLNKELADGSPTAIRYGLSLQKTADGAVDVNATMLEAIEVIRNIKDPTERAAAAQTLLGRSYAEVAELIESGSSKVASSLRQVSDSKVITEEELAKAREFRAAMDELQDKLQDLMITVGQHVVPAIIGFIDVVEDVDDAIEASKIPEFVDLLGDLANNAPGVKATAIALGLLNDESDETAQTTGILSGAVEKLTKEEIAAAEALEKYRAQGSEYVAFLRAAGEANEDVADAALTKAESDKRAADAARRHQEALDSVTEAMERQQDAALQLVGGDIAVRDAQRDAAAAAEELTEILNTQEDGLRGAGAAIDAAASAQLDAASAATEYKVKQMEANGQSVDAKTKAQIYKEELQRLAGQLDGPLLAAIQRYIAELDRIPAQKNTVITTSGGGRVGTGGGETGNLNLTTQPGTVMHDGGIVGGRSFAGMAPDEVAAVLQKGEAVVTPAQQAAMGSSGPVGDITFNITMQGVNDPDAFAEGLRRHVRANGPGNLRRMLGLPPV